MQELKQGAKLTPEEVNNLILQNGVKRTESQYRKGRYGHSIIRSFAGYVFMRAVSDDAYEIILTPFY